VRASGAMPGGADAESAAPRQVLAGSNLIRGMTDQGSAGDPNFARGETTFTSAKAKKARGCQGLLHLPLSAAKLNSVGRDSRRCRLEGSARSVERKVIV
jgi:hypothetical protein